ncbi:MORN repeat-containing protein 1-like [Pyrus ussuriensis x Pyrus communis]|uniref:MORN repeat-containing protein 1-like n=1 Tax=Pyrus ussuriensis x Pyrus communis TaxID=2448454 RepID=A0A5N5EY19_9ROSA|nr:MORN repeat-containing protein 1-like [Pyrus ussuriensis x Pyrus communis]
MAAFPSPWLESIARMASASSTIPPPGSVLDQVIIGPTAIALPLVKFPLVEIPIAIEFDPFPYDLLLLPGLVWVRVRPDEPLDRLRASNGLVEPVEAAPLCILVPGMLEDGDAAVDQTLVLVRQEKREGDEDQCQEEVFGGGYFFAAEVEEEEEAGEAEEGEECDGGHRQVLVVDPGRPGFLVGRYGIVILGFLLFFVVVVVFVGGKDVLLRDRVEAVNGGSNRRRRPQQQRLGPRELRVAFLTFHLENQLID